jgi:parallel beta-helix repeat protein
MRSFERAMAMMICLGAASSCSGDDPSEAGDGEQSIPEDIGAETAENDDSDNSPADTGADETKKPDGTDGYDFDYDYTTHDPIVIDGNEEFHAKAAAEQWIGDGSAENPYIIEGYEIDLKKRRGGAVDVSNTDVHFVVRHCYLHGGIHQLGSAYGYGVLAKNVANMRVERTVAVDNFEGIRLEQGTRDCAIAYNDLSYNAGHGLSLASAHNNVIEYNRCSNEKDDGMLFGSFDQANNFDASNDNTIRFNEFSSNSTSGVCLFRGRGNRFYGNLFGKGNGVAVLNTAGQNQWDNEDEKIGNFWANHKGVDADGDGILDEEKKIPGGGVDRYPLAEEPRTIP